MARSTRDATSKAASGGVQGFRGGEKCGRFRLKNRTAIVKGAARNVVRADAAGDFLNLELVFAD